MQGFYVRERRRGHGRKKRVLRPGLWPIVFFILLNIAVAAADFGIVEFFRQ